MSPEDHILAAIRGSRTGLTVAETWIACGFDESGPANQDVYNDYARAFTSLCDDGRVTSRDGIYRAGVDELAPHHGADTQLRVATDAGATRNHLWAVQAALLSIATTLLSIDRRLAAMERGHDER